MTNSQNQSTALQDSRKRGLPAGWPGNYPVKFWSAEWKDTVIHGRNHKSPERDFSRILDEVLRDRFDGIYPDCVVAYSEKDVVAAAKAGQKILRVGCLLSSGK